MKIVFIPGLLCNARLWQPLIKLLPSSYDTQIINLGKGSTLEEFAQNLLLQLNTRAILVGFSLGAWVALQAYSLAPNCCQALVFIASAPGSLTLTTRQRFIAYREMLTTGKFEAFIEADLAQDVAAVNQAELSLKQTLATMMQEQGPVIGSQQLNSLIQFQANFTNLSHIDCPTLLLRGAEDKSVNIERQNAILNEISRAKLQIISNAAHYIPLENTIETAQVLKEWLESQVF